MPGWLYASCDWSCKIINLQKCRFAVLSQCIAIVVVGMPALQHVAHSRYVGCRSIGGWIGLMLLQRRGRYIGCRNVGGCIGFVLLRSRYGYVGYQNVAFNWWCCAVRVLPSWEMSLGFPHRHTFCEVSSIKIMVKLSMNAILSVLWVFVKLQS